MKIRMPGDKTKVACENCKALRQGTWNYGTYRLKDGREVKDVMILSCDVCSHPCGTATQSGWKIRETLDSAKGRRTTIRLGLPLLDLAATKASEVGGEPKRGPELLALAFLRSLLREPQRLPQVARQLQALRSPLLEGGTKRMNLSLSNAQSDILGRLGEATNLKQSEVIRRALVACSSDPKVHQEAKLMIGHSLHPLPQIQSLTGLPDL